MEFELYFYDLIPAAQEALLTAARLKEPEEANWDSMPITTLTFYEEDKS